MPMKLLKEGASIYAVWEELLALGIKHCFTTSTDNMILTEDNNIDTLKANYQRAKKFSNCKSKETFFSMQVHGKKIETIKTLDDGESFTLGRRLKDTDGLITDIKDITLVTQYADCTPITLFDKNKNILASIHSGWKGTTLKIIEEGIRLMKQEYLSDPADIYCFIWPSIGIDDFEVDKDVADIFKEGFDFFEEVSYTKGNKFHIDIKEINKKMALRNGIPLENIFVSDISTFSDPRFHSYRRDKECSGRMSLISEM